MAVTGYNENPPIPPLEKGGKDKIMSNRRITESVVEEAALSRHQTSRLEVFFR